MRSNEVGKMISEVARVEAAASRMKQKEAQKNTNKDRFCGSCSKFLGTGGMHCAQCTVAFYCDRKCQVQHWKKGGHKQECKKLAAQKFGVKLDAKHCERQHAVVMSFSSGKQSQDSFRKPRGVKFDEKFLVKVQAINDSTPMMIYDETRQCQFSYMSTGPGFHEVLDAVQKEPTWGGRKTFMKASFDKAGVCTMYPGTAGVKNKYSW